MKNLVQNVKIIVIGIIIYSFLPEETKKVTKSVLKKYGFWIILIVILWYGWTRWGVVADYDWIANMKYAQFIFLLCALLYWGVSSFLYEMRYNTIHLIADNIHGSCHRYQEISNLGPGVNWVIFFLDGSGTSDDRLVIPWPFARRLVIVPKVACQFIGNQILIKSQLSKLEWNSPEIPEDVADFIEKDTFARWCKEEIYIGYFSIEIKATDPKYSEVELMSRKKDARINELKEMLRGKLTTVKGFVSDTMAMQDKLRGKDWRKNPQPQQME